MSDDAIIDPATIERMRREFLALCGLNAAEITDTLSTYPVEADLVIGVTRVAERVGAMEAYLRAKIMKERRGGRIVLPFQKN